jgi:hypothetical protein
MAEVAHPPYAETPGAAPASPQVSFSELVDAWKWREESEWALKRYRELRAAFERDHGEILDAYLCKSSGMAVAMTAVDPRPALLRRQRLHLYAETEPLIRHHPEVAPVLHQYELRYVTVQNALRGLSQRHLVNWLFVCMRDLMILAAPSDQEIVALSRDELGRFEAELGEMAAEYDRAASSEARIVYLSGMLSGVAALCLLMVPIGLLLSTVEVPVDMTFFFGCLIAGALGALVSVVTRMSADKFQLRHEVGRTYIRHVAAFRPFVGSVFGLLIYFALAGELIRQLAVPKGAAESFAFYLVLAFAAGFSERLVKEVIRAAEGPDEGSPPDRTAPLKVELVRSPEPPGAGAPAPPQPGA